MSLTTDIITPRVGALTTLKTKAKGPQGLLPLTPGILLDRPSGEAFGLSQNAGMGWNPALTGGDNYLIFSTSGGLSSDDGNPEALGLHTGHWELKKVIKEAADEFKKLGCVPFATFASDPCDGRTQGTDGMYHSLPSRDIIAMLFLHQIGSLPTRKGIMAVATCDKGLPAAMMALAARRDLPGILVPGGVTLPPESGEDAGKIQSIGARFSHGLITLDEAQDLGCRACASPGGGCQFLGTAATSQVVGEALGLSLPHSALVPSGSDPWLDLGRRSARALTSLKERGIKIGDILTDGSVRNAMVVHAAFGGSTNLLLHVPAIANLAGLKMPKAKDWHDINLVTPRLVDVLPNGPVGHPTVRVFCAGGVPEVMLHLRSLDLLDLNAMTVTGEPLGEVLKWWETSEHRKLVRELLQREDGVNPDDVIMTPSNAHRKGLTSTVAFVKGNLAPDGGIIKSTAIDPSVIGPTGVYEKIGPVKVFADEGNAIKAIKKGDIKAGDIMVLIGFGPKARGMPELYQITSALKHLPFGKEVALLTDARFSGVSTGACIGHIGPEAIDGGPIGKLKNGDIVKIIVDTRNLTGSIDLLEDDNNSLTPEFGSAELEKRKPNPDLNLIPRLRTEVSFWAGLQSGTWTGATIFPIAQP